MKKSVVILCLPLLLISCGKTETNWSEPEYYWSKDCSKCTAKMYDLDNPSNKLTETVKSIYSTKREATCESYGVAKYTAYFENDEFDTQYVELTLSPIGHDWGETIYIWSDDNSQCTATRICQNDEDHIQTETKTSEFLVIDEPTYTEDGLGRYTVSFDNDEFEAQTKEVPITKLEKLVFTKHETYYSVKAHSTNIFGDIVIPSEYNGLPIRTIEASGFLHCSLIESITLPDSITSIGKSAFAGCTSLQSINIPGSISVIFDQVFNGCTSLKTVTIGEGVSSIGTRNGGSWAFKGCTALEDLYLPDSIALIGIYAFQGCTSLKNVRWPDNQLEIQMGAFFQCESLRTAPTKIAEMYSLAFAGCKSLTEVTISNAYFSGTDFYSNCTSLKRVIFAEGLKTIPEYLRFENCSSLIQVILCSTLTGTGVVPFLDCPQLYEVINKSSLDINKSDTNIFNGCENIEYIIPSESQTKLGELDGVSYYIKTNGNIVFVDYNNKNCESLTIPSYITEIGNLALYNFDKLANLSFEGTSEQWASITKGTDWNSGVPATVVHCSDIDVNL